MQHTNASGSVNDAWLYRRGCRAAESGQISNVFCLTLPYTAAAMCMQCAISILTSCSVVYMTYRYTAFGDCVLKAKWSGRWNYTCT